MTHTRQARPSGSAWSATPSWGAPTRRPGATRAATSTSRAAPRPRRRRPGATRRPRATRPTASAGQHVETDWRRLLERDDIDLIDICTPGDTHAEIAVAALEAGKHVLCEKPLANSVEEAERMVAAAEAAAGARRPLDGGLHLPPGARPSRYARQLVAGGTARRASCTCAAPTCRTGSSTPSRRSPGGCRRSAPARGPSATSAPTSSTSPTSSRASGSPGVSATDRDLRARASAAPGAGRRHQRPVAPRSAPDAAR